MKIGIITLPLHTNYGGLLQAYALQAVLERIGHNVVVLDTPNKKTLKWNYPLSIVRRCINKFILRKGNKIFYEQWHNKTYPIISKYTQPFTNRNINRLEISDFQQLPEELFDAFVVGSDQVWRPVYFTMLYNLGIKHAYLDFAKEWDVKRIAYAASFGVAEWELNEEQTIECAHLAKLFDAVSVRENSGITLCNKFLDIEASLVLDPTLLLEKDDYIKLIETEFELASEGDFFCYILDDNENVRNAICNIEKELTLRSFQVKAKKSIYETKLEGNREDYIIPSPAKWLRAFMDAKMVFTDSFHGCVFSIIFNKPFWVIGNKGRGNARFDSLLKLFNLESRRIDINEINDIDFALPINWDEVNSIKKEWQSKSIKFLKDNL